MLKDLPVHNQENFSLYNIDSGARTSSMKRPSVYLPTVDVPAEQSEFLQNKSSILIAQQQLTRFISFFSHHYREEKHSSALPSPNMGQEERTKEARS
jgi:hypothetical protein